MKSDPSCVFCKIVAGEFPLKKVLKEEGFLAIKDIQPIASGHSLVFSVNHYSDPAQMPEEERGRLFNFAFKVAKEVAGRSYNLLVCSDEIAQSSVPHRPHIHVIPRRVGDNLHLDPRT